MFGYFGSKRRLAGSYPPPQYNTIIEPFAGAAGYSMHADNWTRNVILYDVNPAVIDVWRWLQNAEPSDVLDLPDIEPGGYPVPIGSPAYHMMQWTKGGDSNTYTPSPWTVATWPSARNNIASNVHKIRHWRIIHGDYTDAPDTAATWFIDPPYQHQGARYTYGSSGIDYQSLASWCRTRTGQVIVCEQDPADWLPFNVHRGNRTQRQDTVRELMWSNQPAQTLFVEHAR